MGRIYVDEEDEEVLAELNQQLDDAGIDYDFDEGGRYLIDADDIDEALRIMDDAGVDAELV